jgi:voltage-gated potassium channel
VILTAPWFLIPGLESTEILQLARVARLLRIVAVTPSARLIAQRLGQVGVFAGGMLLFSSWAAYIAEHATNPGFATYGDALWWGIVTLTTVGYGDIVPKTQTGRISGVFLMLTGVATLGIISGTLASFFKTAKEKEAADEQDGAVEVPPSTNEVVAELGAVREQLALLEARLSQRGGSVDTS